MTTTSLPLRCAVALLLVSSCAAQAGYECYNYFGCYKLHTALANWHDAYAICNSEGGHLGIINSDNEAMVYSAIFSRMSWQGYCFMGFHDMFSEGVFVTVFGVPLEATGYSKWEPGRPDDHNGEDCGSMAQGGLLNDAECEDNRPFICERPNP